MKIRILSDLHMEGENFQYDPLCEDVVILAGDIHTKNRHDQLLIQIPETTKVMMVMGNHELYNGEYYSVLNYLSNLHKEYPNVQFLNNTSTSVGDIEFFGGMMCTSLMLHGEASHYISKDAARRGINDFYVSNIVDNGVTRRWSVDDHIAENTEFRRNLGGWLKVTEGKKRVVISHFVPHPSLIHPRWGGVQNALNPYFCDDMSNYIGWEGLWVYAHTHDCNDKMIGDTRFVGNPRGYVEENALFDSRLIVEI